MKKYELQKKLRKINIIDLKINITLYMKNIITRKMLKDEAF